MVKVAEAVSPAAIAEDAASRVSIASFFKCVSPVLRGAPADDSPGGATSRASEVRDDSVQRASHQGTGAFHPADPRKCSEDGRRAAQADALAGGQCIPAVAV